MNTHSKEQQPMPKHAPVSVALTSHVPSRPDGSIRQGDTVTFAVTPPDAGVITVYGSRDGQILASWSIMRGQFSTVLGPSNAWTASPGPLQAHVTVSELVQNNVKVIAETEFEIAG